MVDSTPPPQPLVHQLAKLILVLARWITKLIIMLKMFHLAFRVVDDVETNPWLPFIQTSSMVFSLAFFFTSGFTVLISMGHALIFGTKYNKERYDDMTKEERRDFDSFMLDCRILGHMAVSSWALTAVWVMCRQGLMVCPENRLEEFTDSCHVMYYMMIIYFMAALITTTDLVIDCSKYSNDPKHFSRPNPSPVKQD